MRLHSIMLNPYSDIEIKNYKMNMEKNQYIFGIRAVIEAIEAGRDIDKILIKKDLSG